MPISSLKEPVSASYIYIDKSGNLQVILPVVSGDTIAMDNTCKTTRALQDFFIDSPRGANNSVFSVLSEYKSALIDDLTLLKENGLESTSVYQSKYTRLCQVDCYSALLYELAESIRLEAKFKLPSDLRGLEIDLPQALWHYPQFISNLIAQSKNLFAIHLNPAKPYGNLRTSNPTFSACGFLGLGLRNLFATDPAMLLFLRQRQDDHNPKEKIKKLITDEFPGEFDFNILRNHITEQIKITCKTEDIDLNKMANGEVFTENHVKALLKQDEITAIDVFNFISYKCLAEDFWLSAVDTPFAIISLFDEDQQFDKLALLIQFYLAHINIHCASNNLSTVNFGLALDRIVWLQWRLLHVIKNAFSEDITQVTKKIFDFINREDIRKELLIHRELGIKDYDLINARFVSSYKTAMRSDHPDEFMIFLPEHHGLFVNHQGKIAVSLNRAFLATRALGLAQAQAQANDHFLEFIQPMAKFFDAEIKIKKTCALDNQNQAIAIEHVYILHLAKIKEICANGDLFLGLGYIKKLADDPSYVDKHIEIREFILAQATDCLIKTEYDKAKTCYTYALFFLQRSDEDYYYYAALLRLRRIQCMAIGSSSEGYEKYLKQEIGFILSDLRVIERWMATKHIHAAQLYCCLLNLPGISIEKYRQEWLIKLIDCIILYQVQDIELLQNNLQQMLDYAYILMQRQDYEKARALYQCIINSIVQSKTLQGAITQEGLSELYTKIGDCCTVMGKAEDARIAYDKADKYSSGSVKQTILWLASNPLSSVPPASSTPIASGSLLLSSAEDISRLAR